MRTSEGLLAPRGMVAIVAMGASTGGIAALGTVLAALPGSLPVPVVMVQHLEPHRASSLPEILGRRTALRSVEPTDGERLQPGTCYIAPPGRNLEIGTDGTLRLRDGQDAEHRPRADALFESMAKAYGAGSLAIVLTGAGTDGARGVAQVHEVGGHVLCQDPDSADAAGMPQATMATGVVDRVLCLDDIGAEILRLVTGDGDG